MDDQLEGRTPPPTAPSEHSPWAVAALGVQFFVALFLFAWAGNWLDNRWGTSPWLVLAGVMVGGGGSFYLNYKRLMRGDDSTNVNTKRESGTHRDTPSS